MGGFFTIPYFYVHKCPTAPVSKVVIYCLHTFGVVGSLFIDLFFMLSVFTLFSVGYSLFEWQKRQWHLCQDKNS